MKELFTMLLCGAFVIVPVMSCVIWDDYVRPRVATKYDGYKTKTELYNKMKRLETQIMVRKKFQIINMNAIVGLKIRLAASVDQIEYLTRMVEAYETVPPVHNVAEVT